MYNEEQWNEFFLQVKKMRELQNRYFKSLHQNQIQQEQRKKLMFWVKQAELEVDRLITAKQGKQSWLEM